MIIILKSGIGDAEIDDVCRRVTEMGYAPHIIRGEFKTIVAAVGEERGRPDLRLLEAVETVESVMPVQQPFKLASREVRQTPSEVRIGAVTVGGGPIVVMAGPCSVESESQMREVAVAVKAAGADGLIIEVHNNPAEALSDGPQSLKPDKFARLMAELRPLAEVLGRSL